MEKRFSTSKPMPIKKKSPRSSYSSSSIKDKLKQVKRRGSFTTNNNKNFTKSVPSSPRRKSFGKNGSDNKKRLSLSQILVSPRRNSLRSPKKAETRTKPSLSISSPTIIYTDRKEEEEEEEPKKKGWNSADGFVIIEEDKSKLQIFNDKVQWESIACKFDDKTTHVFQQVEHKKFDGKGFTKTFGRLFLKTDQKKKLGQFIFTDILVKEFRQDQRQSCQLIITNRGKSEKLTFNIQLSLTGFVHNPLPCLYFLIIPKNYVDMKKFKIGIAIDKTSLEYVSFDNFKAVQNKLSRQNTVQFCMMQNCDQSGDSSTACTCRCGGAMYCKFEHQIIDWEARHKHNCLLSK